MEEIFGKPDEEVAALAVRSKSKFYIEAGVKRLAKSGFIADHRDALSSICLYYDALKRIGVDPQGFLQTISKDFGKEFENFVLAFTNRKDEDKTLKAFRYRVEFDPEFNYKNWYEK